MRVNRTSDYVSLALFLLDNRNIFVVKQEGL